MPLTPKKQIHHSLKNQVVYLNSHPSVLLGALAISDIILLCVPTQTNARPKR